jgi:thiol-disulfide isomerase/thioredoxin
MVLAAPAWASNDSHYLHRQGNKTLRELLQVQLDAAGKAKQTDVLLMFTADWCSPCKAIKEFVKSSAVVRKAIGKRKLIYIDVDEWRGPAQSLLPGIDASKLPTMAAVAPDWKVVQHCFGSEIGLLHEDAVAHNLERLLDGKAIEKPFYADKPDLEREFMLKQNDAQTAKTKGEAILTVTAKGPAASRKVKIVLRNHDAPRRWYLIPAKADQPLVDRPNVRTGWKARWTEHVRADFLRVQGSPDFYAIPVAGYGGIELEDVPLTGVAKDGKLTVWELDFLKIDGQDQQFQQKLPYELKIAKFEQTAIAGQGESAKFEFKVRAKHAVPLK